MVYATLKYRLRTIARLVPAIQVDRMQRDNFVSANLETVRQAYNAASVAYIVAK